MKRRRSLVSLSALVLLGAFVAAGGPVDASARPVTPSHTKALAPRFVVTTKKKQTTPTTKQKQTTTTGVTTTAPGLDLRKTPPIIAASYSSQGSQVVGVYYFDHLSNSPKITVGPLASADRYVLSPNGRYAAVAHAGDAVRKARLEIVSTRTGKAHSFELDADGVVVAGWAPDNTAVLAGAESSTGTHNWAVYRVDGSSQALTQDYVYATQSLTEDPGTAPWVRGKSGTTVMECDHCGGLYHDTFQLVTSKGVPVFVTDTFGVGGQLQVGRYDVDTGQVVAYPGAFGAPDPNGPGPSGVGCGRFATITATTVDDRGYATKVDYGLYDSDSDKVTPISLKAEGARCPLASNGGTLVAFESTDGVGVVDLATGTQTPVARQGYPIGWSKDDSKVLVQGNGTFVVAADGSGGKQASIAVQDFCTVGKTGAVITSAPDPRPDGLLDLLYYDIASDVAKPIGNGRLDSWESCDVSANGKWVVSDHTVIDLGRGRAATITISDHDKAPLNVGVQLWG